MSFCADSLIAERQAFQLGGGGSIPTSAHHFNKAEWRVRPASLRDAQSLVREHHYSRGGSNTAVYVHGLYRVDGDELCGVAWWLPPTRVACESVNKGQWKRVLSLTRLVVVPGVPKNACSFLLAHSVRMIRSDGRFVSLVTYADESQGHTGAIYRAAGWQYVGRTGPSQRWVNASGRQVSCKATKNRTKAQMLALGHRPVGSFHKHKFVLHLTPFTVPQDEAAASQATLHPSGVGGR